jgi:hypothetical protein
MDVKDIVDSVFKLVSLINTFWTAYATVTIALLGWLFSSKSPWPRQQRLVISIAYGLVAALNCLAHYRINRALNLVVNELTTHKDLTPNLQQAFSVAEQMPAWILMLIHVSVDVAVISLIWLQDRFHRAATKSQEGKELL